PKKASLILPTRALAEAIAEEWAGQGEKLIPATMPLTKLANTAIDRVGAERPRILAEMVDYAASDLVCYRAGRPQGLVARQATHWNPVIDWALTALDAPFKVTLGVVHRPQPPEALHAIAGVIAAMDEYEIAALYTIMTITGSMLITLMLAHGALAADAAWAAAHVDENFQIENWGEDAEATARRAARHKEFVSCCRFVELCREGI
ncbi:MAG: ATP12 family chaperone protein, partial [Aestuariivirga sp.]